MSFKNLAVTGYSSISWADINFYFRCVQNIVTFNSRCLEPLLLSTITNWARKRKKQTVPILITTFKSWTSPKKIGKISQFLEELRALMLLYALQQNAYWFGQTNPAMKIHPFYSVKIKTVCEWRLCTMKSFIWTESQNKNFKQYSARKRLFILQRHGVTGFFWQIDRF